MFPNSILGIAAGICGTLFLGYCIYFDRKRRMDPNFKKLLRERRKAQKEAHAASNRGNIPNLKDNEAIQKYFLQEVQLGEEMLGQGDLVNGVEHLANAVQVCGQPTQLLSVLQSTLPPQVFQLLLQKLTVGGREHQQSATGPRVLSFTEEDVE